MMLLFAPHSSAEKFSAPISGLRSLLAAPDSSSAAAAGTSGAGCVVVTRASVAASHRCGCDRREDRLVKETRDAAGTCSLGHGEDVEIDDTAKADENDTITEVNKERRGDHQARAEEEEDEMDGFWVSYGRRRPRRRLPPPIPSLVARGALRRTRTDDGRLLIRIVSVVRPECVRARRRRDRRRVEREGDDSPMAPPPPQPIRELTAEDGIRINVVAHQADYDDAAAAAVGGEGVRGVEDAVVVEEAAPAETRTLPVMVPHPPRVRSVGCFEEVFKLGFIRTSSLHQMQMPSLRMVH